MRATARSKIRGRFVVAAFIMACSLGCGFPHDARADNTYDGAYEGEDTIVSTLTPLCKAGKYPVFIKENSIRLGFLKAGALEFVQVPIQSDGTFSYTFITSGDYNPRMSTVRKDGKISDKNIEIITTASSCVLKYNGRKVV